MTIKNFSSDELEALSDIVDLAEIEEMCQKALDEDEGAVSQEADYSYSVVQCLKTENSELYKAILGQFQAKRFRKLFLQAQEQCIEKAIMNCFEENSPEVFSKLIHPLSAEEVLNILNSESFYKNFPWIQVEGFPDRVQDGILKILDQVLEKIRHKKVFISDLIEKLITIFNHSLLSGAHRGEFIYKKMLGIIYASIQNSMPTASRVKIQERFESARQDFSFFIMMYEPIIAKASTWSVLYRDYRQLFNRINPEKQKVVVSQLEKYRESELIEKIIRAPTPDADGSP